MSVAIYIQGGSQAVFERKLENNDFVRKLSKVNILLKNIFFYI